MDLKKGTIVKIEGIPLRLLHNTKAFTHPDNEKLISELRSAPKTGKARPAAIIVSVAHIPNMIGVVEGWIGEAQSWAGAPEAGSVYVRMANGDIEEVATSDLKLANQHFIPQPSSTHKDINAGDVGTYKGNPVVVQQWYGPNVIVTPLDSMEKFSIRPEDFQHQKTEEASKQEAALQAGDKVTSYEGHGEGYIVRFDGKYAIVSIDGIDERIKTEDLTKISSKKIANLSEKWDGMSPDERTMYLSEAMPHMGAQDLTSEYTMMSWAELPSDVRDILELPERMGSKKFASRRQAQQQAFDVFLNGEEIDTVFYSVGADVDEEEVKKSLIEHDGYDSGIEVKKSASRRKAQTEYPGFSVQEDATITKTKDPITDEPVVEVDETGGEKGWKTGPITQQNSRRQADLADDMEKHLEGGEGQRDDELGEFMDKTVKDTESGESGDMSEMLEEHLEEDSGTPQTEEMKEFYEDHEIVEAADKEVEDDPLLKGLDKTKDEERPDDEPTMFGPSSMASKRQAQKFDKGDRVTVSPHGDGTVVEQYDDQSVSVAMDGGETVNVDPDRIIKVSRRQAAIDPKKAMECPKCAMKGHEGQCPVCGVAMKRRKALKIKDTWSPDGGIGREINLEVGEPGATFTPTEDGGYKVETVHDPNAEQRIDDGDQAGRQSPTTEDQTDVAHEELEQIPEHKDPNEALEPESGPEHEAEIGVLTTAKRTAGKDFPPFEDEESDEGRSPMAMPVDQPSVDDTQEMSDMSGGGGRRSRAKKTASRIISQQKDADGNTLMVGDKVERAFAHAEDRGVITEADASKHVLMVKWESSGSELMSPANDLRKVSSREASTVKVVSADELSTIMASPDFKSVSDDYADLETLRTEFASFINRCGENQVSLREASAHARLLGINPRFVLAAVPYLREEASAVGLRPDALVS